MHSILLQLQAEDLRNSDLIERIESDMANGNYKFMVLKDIFNVFLDMNRINGTLPNLSINVTPVSLSYLRPLDVLQSDDIFWNMFDNDSVPSLDGVPLKFVGRIIINDIKSNGYKISFRFDY